MKFILSGLGSWHRSWKLMQEAVPVADELGFWGVVMPDHYMWGEPFGRGLEQPNSTLDTWVALTYLASRTNRIRLGSLVTPIPFRPPGILAKMVSTLDILSSGRTVLGVGAGWSRVEFEGYSEWNDAKTRVDKTEEGVRLILELWQKEKVDFEGKFYRAKGAVLEPKPVQKPHPPLLFGGAGPRMLRLAGRYGDICLIRSSPQMTFDEAKAVVSQEARRVKRREEPSYAGGSPRFEETKFDPRSVSRNVEKASNDGCEFYVMPFPREDYVESMKLFASDVMPSYSSIRQGH